MGSKGSQQRFYFSVGTKAAHATVWRLWAEKKHGDVYLGSRMHAGNLKLSVHASGLRLLRQKVSGGDALYLDGGMERWEGGPRHSPGVERVWRIVTPATELRDAKMPEKFTEQVTWISPGAPNTVTEFELVLAFGLIIPDGRHPYDDRSGALCLRRWRLATGETLFLLHRTYGVSQEDVAWLAGHRAKARSQMPVDWDEPLRAGRHDVRLQVVTHQPEIHFRGCIDLAVDPLVTQT